MSGQFVIHLGGGLYLDAEGRVTTGLQAEATQVYAGSGGLKLDTDKVKQTLKDIADFLKDEENLDKVRKLGLSPKLLKGVLEAAKVGAIAATYASVAFAALGILLTVIGELTKDDGLSPELKQLLLGLKDDIKAVDDRLLADAMLGVQAVFHTGAMNIAQQLQDIIVQKLQGPARIPKFVEMQDEMKPLRAAITSLRGIDWSPLYRPDDYKEVFLLSPWLHTRRPDGSYALLSVTPTVRHFDYRLGVPVYAYIATAFPVLAAAGLPWYRSTGSYALWMRELANQIDSFVTRMYSDSFARTIHTAQTLFQSEGRQPSPVPALKRNTPFQDEFLVGAVDLVRFSDAWFAKEFVEQLQDPGYDTGRRGTLDYSWPRDGRTRLLLVDATVQEVNEQSAQDFATLQVASGMIHLMTAAARLRYFSTPPMESETVSGRASGGRQRVSEEPAKARSPWIFPTGVIEKPATLQRFEARARARIRTQFPGYPFRLNYRVQLVTVDSGRGDAWVDRDYVGTVWQGSYVPASRDARDRRLDVRIDESRVLARHLLHEGPAQPDPVRCEGALRLRASTFDWYMPTQAYLTPKALLEPVPSIKALKEGAGTGAKELGIIGKFGSTSVHVLQEPGSRALMGEGASTPAGQLYEQQFKLPPNLENAAEAIFAEPDLASQFALQGGERRWVRTDAVEIRWQMVWKDGELVVDVFGRPEDRPFQVYVVVEEDIFSGESIPENVQDILADTRLRAELHTPFALEVVNQLLAVPAEFFKAERDAFAFGEKLWADLNFRFAKSREVGRQPPSPVDFHRRLTAVLGDSLTTASLAERQNYRFAFMLEHVPEAVEEVLRDHRVERAEMAELKRFHL